MFAQRTLLRTHFAFIEGITYQLKQVALYSVIEHPGFFSDDEVSLLKEESYSLNKKGEVEVRDNFQRLLPTILFAVKCYTKVHGASYQPDTGHHGWEALGSYVQLRNQLMHPKSTKDLEISNRKLEIATEGATWFKGMLQEMLAACAAADERYRNENST